jgi:DNA polymerase/3'-5' exonuclease PolX
MNYNQALTITNKLIGEIKPYCSRVEIAGGVRRKKVDPHDIELVVVPFWTLEKWRQDNNIKLIKGKDKYWMFNYEGEKIDLFLCTPETYAMNFLIRTGSAEWIHSFMCFIRTKGFCSKNARLCRLSPNTGDDEFPPEPLSNIKEEIDIFRTLQLPWVEPEVRTGSWT